MFQEHDDHPFLPIWLHVFYALALLTSVALCERQGKCYDLHHNVLSLSWDDRDVIKRFDVLFICFRASFEPSEYSFYDRIVAYLLNITKIINSSFNSLIMIDITLKCSTNVCLGSIRYISNVSIIAQKLVINVSPNAKVEATIFYTTSQPDTNTTRS